MFTNVKYQMITFVNTEKLKMYLEQLKSLYSLLKTPELFDRYITNSHIEDCFKKYPKSIISTIGYSVENRPIYSLKFGQGPKKILMWSQMHGNESTTTKALFDCFNLFLVNNKISKTILETCSILVIPILNPDGAEYYTRVNANAVDLNRDAQDLSQQESKVLRQVFDDFKPDFCFNLHGQRTIYNVGKSNIPATLSFLSPAQDSDRILTVNRKAAMSIIYEIKEFLEIEIPNGIARYDDSFNLNCVGDTFQYAGIPTILYEAGHYKNDYEREDVRRLVFFAIMKGLYVISEGVDEQKSHHYFEIPENGKLFYDVIIRNARLNENNHEYIDIGILYEERLTNKKIEFIPIIEVISNLDSHFGHKEINAKEKLVSVSENSQLKVANEIDFVMINNEKISLKPINN